MVPFRTDRRRSYSMPVAGVSVEGVYDSRSKSEGVARLSEFPVYIPGISMGLRLDGPAYGEILMIEPASLHVLTALYAGQVAFNYFDSMMMLQRRCLEDGIPFQWTLIKSDSLVPRARNTLAHIYRTQSKASHALLIDSDIGFEPNAIMEMLALNVPVVSAPYPKKKIRWDRVVKASAALKTISPFGATIPLRDAIASGESVCLPHVSAAEIRPRHPICRERVGAGLMLIKAGVFAMFLDAYPDDWYQPTQDVEADGLKIWNFFPCGVDTTTREYESEDYGFCRRCRQMGIPIVMLPWLRTTHWGNHLYVGDLPTVARLCGEL